MTRPYRLGLREESAQRTRESILRAADRLLTRKGIGSFTMDAVARAARVSRITVYDHFRDKAGLLEAVTWRMFLQHDVDRVRRARLQPDVRRSLVDFVRENARYQHRFGAGAMALLRAAMTDPEAATVVQTIYVDSRRSSIRELVDRLDNAGELAEEWTAERAVNALMIVTGLESLDSLTSQANVDVEEAAEVLVQLASGLLRPAGATR